LEKNGTGRRRFSSEVSSFFQVTRADATKSFCIRQRRGDFDLSNRDELWNLPVRITLRKARNTAIRHFQGKRDVRREDAEAAVDRPGDDPSGTILDQIDSDGPTPAEAGLLNEAPERRFQMLKNPNLRRIALWKLEGNTNPEIARTLGPRSATASHAGAEAHQARPRRRQREIDLQRAVTAENDEPRARRTRRCNRRCGWLHDVSFYSPR
jgi:hypothetical protein